MSPTWYIERIPATGGAPDIRTLEGWGIDSAAITELCWGIGTASLQIPSNTAGTTAPAWEEKDHIVVWAGNPAAGGTRKAHLWVILAGNQSEAAGEAHPYQLVGPSYWLEVTQFFYPLTVSDITTDPGTGAATGCTWHMRHGTEVVWTNWADQSSGTIKGQLHRALWCAIDNDAPIAIGAIDIPGLAPVLDQLGLTCADVVARAARFSPRASQWWDHSGATPVFRAAALASRPAATIALVGPASSWAFSPRHDLRIDVVRVGYQYPEGDGVAAYYDIAGDDTLKDGAHTLRSLVDCPDEHSAANASVHYLIASQLYAALHSTPYDGSAAWPDDGSGLPAVHPGHALSLTGGLAAWATMAAPIASTTLTITAAAVDTLQVQLGLPSALGANDLFELYNLAINLGSGAVNSGGGTTHPSTGGPKTYGDLTPPEWLPSCPPSGGLEYQSRGGTCVLVGFSEFSPASAPPRKYLTRSFSGEITANVNTGAGYSRITIRTFLGADTFNITTGAVSFGGLLEEHDHFSTPGSEDHYQQTPSSAQNFGVVQAIGVGDGRVSGSITSAATRHQGCWVCTDYSASGMLYADLTSEYTEEAAYEAMLATHPWPVYPEGDPKAGQEQWSGGAAPVAVYEQRTSGFDFTRTKFRYRGTFGNIGAWWSMRITIPVLQRRMGTQDAWTQIGERVHVVSAGLDGNASLGVQEVEAEKGYEVTLGNPDYVRI